MAHLPEQLVDAWMQENLNPVELIPALVQYTDADFDPRTPQMLQSIRWLQLPFCFLLRIRFKPIIFTYSIHCVHHRTCHHRWQWSLVVQANCKKSAHNVQIAPWFYLFYSLCYIYASSVHRYLEFCVNERHCDDESIHNYLIALYARLGDSKKLEDYLLAQVSWRTRCSSSKWSISNFKWSITIETLVIRRFYSY